MDGGVRDVVREAITKVGLITIRNIFDSGFRHTSSTRQVNTVEDLNGFKIRVPVTALLTSLFTGLGHRLRASAITNFILRCKLASWMDRKSRLLSSEPVSYLRCRNIARCRIIVGADSG